MTSFRTLSLTSSCFFLVGVALALLGYLAVLEDRAVHAILQMIAWAMVSLSVLPEIWIDLSGVANRLSTAVYHGRYGLRSLAILSWLQSLSFLGGAITMGMAMKREWDEDFFYKSDLFRLKEYAMSWEALFMLSSILMSMSGLLAIFSSGCCCCAGGGRDPDETAQQTSIRTVVQTSNGMFMAGAAILLFAISIDGFCPTCFLGFFAVVFSYGMWCACSILWIIADAKLPRGVNPEEQESNHN